MKNSIFTKSENSGYFRIEKSDIWQATKFFKIAKTSLVKYSDFYLVREEKVSENPVRKTELKRIYVI